MLSETKKRKFITRIPKTFSIEEEKIYIDKWNKNKISLSIWKREADMFFLHSGPTYANAELHLGNLYNLVLKDAINKMYCMLGYKVALSHGADTHGLPIINKVLKLYFENEKPSNEILWRKCKDFALECISMMKKSISDLGILLHDHFYKTLDNDFELKQLMIFQDLVNKGYIKYDLMPVYKCIKCKTALSFNDISKKDKNVECLYFLFPIQKQNKFILFWTTSIYSIAFNQGASINTKIKYAEYTDENGRNIIASKHFFEKRNIECRDIDINTLIDFKYINLNDEVCSIFTSDTVIEETGTGIVHLSSECSQDDYVLLAKNNIRPRKITFDDDGLYENQNIHDIKNFVQKLLQDKELIYDTEIIEKSVSICVRCKHEAIVACSQQCFFDISHNDLKNRCIQKLSEYNPLLVNPNIINAHKTLAATLALREEWCISRQRIWGLFIPAINCLDCQKAGISKLLLNRYIELLIRNIESNSWLDIEMNDVKCEFCSSSNVNKLLHTFDVWFDAGVTNIILQQQFNIEKTDLILEGNDQFKGWYQVLLLTEMAYKEKWSIDNILCHGFIRDLRKQKLSKSLDNYESSSAIRERYGAEIIRIYFCLQEYSSDPFYSQQHLTQAKTEYHSLRNTLRFLFWSIEGTKNSIPTNNIRIWEQLFYEHFCNVVQNVVIDFKNSLGIHKVWRTIKEFLSYFNSFYLDSVKDILFLDNPSEHPDAFSIYRLCKHVLLETLRLLSPVISFTCEEFWGYLFEEKVVDQESIFLSPIETKETYTDKKLIKNIKLLIDNIDDIENSDGLLSENELKCIKPFINVLKVRKNQ